MTDTIITVFTPTYNRRYTIERLYQSLQKQTFDSFEWIVIDDGSNDHTDELFEKWLQEDHIFKITYRKVENGGKHRAINQGVMMAKGKLFFIVDSDDYLTDDALQKVAAWEAELPKGNTKFAGVAGAKGYNQTENIGKCPDKKYVDAISQKRFQYGIEGDKAEVFYTEILKQFPFPAFEGENFITESVVWFAIGKAGYEIRWFNDIIYIADYLPDGLTNNESLIFRRNPKGYLLLMRSDLDNLDLSFIRKCAYYAMYYEIASDIGKSRNEVLMDLQISKSILTLSVLLKKIKKKLILKK